MNWRTNAEIRESFDARAAVLDEAIAIAQANPALRGVRVVDECNRTGVGKEVIPYFSYDISLEDRREDGPVSVARVRLSFLEPPLRDVRATVIEALWRAEQFWPGSGASLMKVEGRRTWDVSSLPTASEIAGELVRMMFEARHAVGRPLGS